MNIFVKVLPIFFLSSVQYTRAGHDKVLLTNVQVLTLYKDQRTTGRRNSPVPQLKCDGGSAGCHAFQPSTVQCYNRGFDGTDVQWECKADMDYAYKFGKVEVSCEGFDYPNDPYILKGSCGAHFEWKPSGPKSYYVFNVLIYTIDNAPSEGSKNQYGDDDYSYKKPKKSAMADIIFWIIIGLFVFVLYRIFTAPSTPTSAGGSSAGGYGGGGGGGGGGGPPGGGHRPDYYSSDDSCHRSNYDSYGSAPQGGSRPGFWTGLGAGGLLGYLMGNRGNSFTGGQGYWGGPPGPSHGRSSGGFSSFGSGGSTRSASGFGGTSRR